MVLVLLSRSSNIITTNKFTSWAVNSLIKRSCRLQRLSVFHRNKYKLLRLGIKKLKKEQFCDPQYIEYNKMGYYILLECKDFILILLKISILQKIKQLFWFDETQYAIFPLMKNGQNVGN